MAVNAPVAASTLYAETLLEPRLVTYAKRGGLVVQVTAMLVISDVPAVPVPFAITQVCEGFVGWVCTVRS